ncbi:MAG: EscU/YscU/HrcU family type III secretion system export apparatus switch protein [Myxococcota bacterium]
MSEDKSQKTEQATPRKRQQLRKEGKVPQSKDVGGAAVLGLVALLLATNAESLAEGLFIFARRTLSLRGYDAPLLALAGLEGAFFQVAAPPIAVAFLGALIAGLTQTRGYFGLKNLVPKPERFNPLPQLKKILPGKESGLELVKAALKLVFVVAVVGRVAWDRLPVFLALGRIPIEAGITVVAKAALEVLRDGFIALSVLAALDWVLVKRKFGEESKMSKQDIKDEMKQSEGDPHVKGKRRAKQREVAARVAQAGRVQDATVLVTNPTHISIALRYDPARDAVPMMLAKGTERLALRMRETARRHGIPIVENRPFARAMFKSAKLGEPLPEELFGPAAEVIAHVLRLRGVLPGRAPAASAAAEVNP